MAITEELKCMARQSWPGSLVLFCISIVVKCLVKYKHLLVVPIGNVGHTLALKRASAISSRSADMTTRPLRPACTWLQLDLRRTSRLLYLSTSCSSTTCSADGSDALLFITASRSNGPGTCHVCTQSVHGLACFTQTRQGALMCNQTACLATPPGRLRTAG